MARGRLVAAAVGAALLVGSAVAGAQERPVAPGAYPDVKVSTDCGCTGPARAKSRLEMGLIKTPAATAATEG